MDAIGYLRQGSQWRKGSARTGHVYAAPAKRHKCADAEQDNRDLSTKRRMRYRTKARGMIAGR
eukprot:scaffold281525_cov32-Tisochrysis_lutea.AAC.6